MAAIVTFFASFIYLFGFFGMSFVQAAPYMEMEEEDELEETTPKFESDLVSEKQDGKKDTEMVTREAFVITGDDEEVIQAVVSGKISSYSLESKLGDCKRAAFIRRVALEIITRKSLDGLPLEGLDYESIPGQSCKMSVYVQIPVGIAGPLLLDEKEFSVPIATTEGCLVASTNRRPIPVEESVRIFSVGNGSEHRTDSDTYRQISRRYLHRRFMEMII